MQSPRSARPFVFKKFSPWVVAALLCVGGWLLACVTPAFAQTSGDGTTFFYAGGHKQYLHPSKRWVAVLHSAGATVNPRALSQQLLGSNAGDKTRYYRGVNVSLLSVKSAVNPRSLKQLRTRASAVRGVQQVLRVFGADAYPIIETTDFVVRFQPGISGAVAGQLVGAQGAYLVKPLGRQAPNGFIARVKNPAIKSAIDAANALYGSPQVMYSHPDLLMKAKPKFIPNDPLYTQQWHLNNTGQGGGSIAADVRAQQAWDLNRGSSSITVAILDTGIDIDHEEFKGTGKIVAPFDFNDNDNDPRPDPANDSDPASEENHGTACSGVAVATGSNAIGVSGIAPNCRLMPIRLLGGLISFSTVSNAFRYCTDNGADILSNSWGFVNLDFLPDVIKGGMDYAVNTGRDGKGTIVMFAAGNDAVDVATDPLASYPPVIAVAASTNFDRRSFYSNFGTAISVCAPSNGGSLGIFTADRTGSVGYSTSNYTNSFGGTSSACPLVAGVAALILSDDPSLSYVQVRQRLESTADKIDTSNGGYDSTGHSALYGFGRVNALRALQASNIKHFSVGGRVALADGTGVGGVQITLNPNGLAATTTANGDFLFPSVAAGTITLTPKKNSYTFNPVSRTLILSGNVTGLTFTAVPPIQVSLTNPAAGTTVNNAIQLQATTTGGSTVSRVDFARSVPVVDKTNTVNLPIPDQGQVTNVINVASEGKIESASISINIQHQYIGDLQVTLISPDGKSFILHDHTGGAGTSIKATYDTLPLVGATANGNWSLRVMDDQPVDTGTLISWGVHLVSWVPLGGSTTPSATGVSDELLWQVPFNPATTPRGAYSFRATAITSSEAFSDINTNVTVTPPLFAISGQVLNALGKPAGSIGLTTKPIVNGVVQSSPALNVTTAADGTYSFTRLNPGSYLVTPTVTALASAFSPVNRTVTITTANLTGMNFRILPVYTLSGVIKTNTGLAMAGVTVQCSGVATTKLTDINGAYSFTALSPGTYTITASKANYGFTPAARTVTITTASLANLNFTGTSSLTITGRITTNTGIALAGVSVLRSGSSTPVLTNTNGVYTFSGLVAGTYTLTPSKAGYVFFSSATGKKTLTVTLTTFSIPNANFIALRAFNISGTVRNSNGIALAGVTMQCTGGVPLVHTALNGTYTFANVGPGTYTITPSLSGFNFLNADKSGSSTMLTLNGADVLNINFTGSAVPPPPFSVARSASSSTLSSSSLQLATGGITLTFTRPLDADSATDPSHYTAIVDGILTALESAAYRAATNAVILSLPEGVLRKGSSVQVKWSGLLDSTGASVADGGVNLSSR